MSHAEPNTKMPSRQTAAFATFRAFLCLPGIGTLSHPRKLVLALSAAGLLALSPAFTFLAPIASADGRIGEPGGAGPGQLESAKGLAVSNKENGDIYVADGYRNDRVDQFTPAGTFVRAFGWGVLNGASELQTCTTSCQLWPEYEAGGSGPGQLESPDEIAVDNDPASASYGDVYVVDQRNFRVEKYTPVGEFLLMFGGEVDKTKAAEFNEPGNPHGITEAEVNVCTASDLAGGDTCGAGEPGTGPSHFYKTSPTRSWAREGFNSIAVGPNGTVYVGDYGRIQEFEPSGAFAGEFELPDAGEHTFVSALALNSSGDIYERSAAFFDGQLHQVPGVREFNVESPRQLIHTFDVGAEEAGSEPIHIALDENGDLFVSDANGSEAEPQTGEFRFRAFKPNGTLYAEFTSDQVTPSHSGYTSPANLAFGDITDTLYATSTEPDGIHVAAVPPPPSGPPTVGKETVSDIQPTTATPHAIINPSGFDTEYHLEYVDQQSYEDEGGFASPHTKSTAPVSLGLINRPDPAQVAISALVQGTRYRYRFVAESHCNESNLSEVCTTDGADETFETLLPITVRDFTTQTVGPELVTLKAELNPNGSESTYTIHYGEDPSGEDPPYSGGAKEGSLRIGNEFKQVEATFTGLKPNTVYHYQLVGHNTYGDVETVDQTFTTEHSGTEERAAEDCPVNGTVHGEVRNTLREENNSLSLPDCRAYERTTEARKEGGEVFNNALGLAPSGERVWYQSEGTFAGAQRNQLTITYFAHRTEAGWVTEPVVQRLQPSPVEPGSPFGLISGELDRWLQVEEEGLNAIESNKPQPSVYFSLLSAVAPAVVHATPTLSPVEGGLRFNFHYSTIVDMSDDLSTAFIATTSRLLPSPGDERLDAESANLGGSDRIYAIRGIGGANPTLTLAAEVPLGLTSAPGSSGENACFVSPPFTIGRSMRNRPGYTTADGATLVYTAPIEVEEGKECGAGEPNPYGLFARTGEAPPVQINAPYHCTSGPCTSASPATPLYDGVASSGRFVWFTTTQSLVNGDTDATNDLYLAKLAPDGQLEELIQASAGTATATHPTVGQGANVGEGNQGVVRISKDGSHIAFESPAVLTEESNALGQAAVQHANNLYVYDASTGELKFVTDLCSGSELSGVATDAACPATLDGGVGVPPHQWNNDEALWRPSGGEGDEAAFTASGSYLMFTSFGRLASDDTDNVRDVYRYSFQSGELTRASIGRRGNDGNGNDNLFPAEFGEGYEPSALEEDASRSISADGGVVIFRTAAPLVSHDTDVAQHPGCGELAANVNGTGCDIYEWEEQGHGTCTEAGGCVSLVSSGLDAGGSNIASLSSSGRDILFHTRRNMIPEDADGIGDLYDARINGGFHSPHPPSPCGSPEQCRPAPAAEPAPPTLATPNFVGPGNAAEKLECAKGRHRVKRHKQVRCVSNRHRRHRSNGGQGHSGKKHDKRSVPRASGTHRGGQK